MGQSWCSPSTPLPHSEDNLKTHATIRNVSLKSSFYVFFFNLNLNLNPDMQHKWEHTQSELIYHLHNFFLSITKLH